MACFSFSHAEYGSFPFEFTTRRKHRWYSIASCGHMTSAWQCTVWSSRLRHAAGLSALAARQLRSVASGRAHRLHGVERSHKCAKRQSVFLLDIS